MGERKSELVKIDKRMEEDLTVKKGLSGHMVLSTQGFLELSCW